MFAEMCLRVGRTLLRLGCRRVTGSGTDPIGYAKCAGKFAGCVAGVLASMSPTEICRLELQSWGESAQTWVAYNE